MPAGREEYQSGQQPTADEINRNERVIAIEAGRITDDHLAVGMTLDTSRVRNALPTAGGVLSGDIEFTDPGGVGIRVDQVDPSKLKADVDLMARGINFLSQQEISIKHSYNGVSQIWTTEAVPEGAVITGNNIFFPTPDGYDGASSSALLSFAGFSFPAGNTIASIDKPLRFGISPVEKSDAGITIAFDLMCSWTNSFEVYYYATLVWVKRGLY